jgi:signal transduction histidine kinase
MDVHERKELDRAKTRFLAMMAHELRTPLTPMRTYMQTLGRASGGEAPVRRDLVDKLVAQLDPRACALPRNHRAAWRNNLVRK